MRAGPWRRQHQRALNPLCGERLLCGEEQWGHSLTVILAGGAACGKWGLGPACA